MSPCRFSHPGDGRGPINCRPVKNNSRRRCGRMRPRSLAGGHGSFDQNIAFGTLARLIVAVQSWAGPRRAHSTPPGRSPRPATRLGRVVGRGEGVDAPVVGQLEGHAGLGERVTGAAVVGPPVLSITESGSSPSQPVLSLRPLQTVQRSVTSPPPKSSSAVWASAGSSQPVAIERRNRVLHSQVDRVVIRISPLRATR